MQRRRIRALRPVYAEKQRIIIDVHRLHVLPTDLKSIVVIYMRSSRHIEDMWTEWVQWM
jgi:hypothetical protein